MTTRTAQLQQELLDALAQWGVQSDVQIEPHTALIASGVLDSVALYSLSLWIEEKVGRPLDPATFDLATQWDSVQSVVAFIERVRDEQPGAAAALSEAPARAAAPTMRTGAVAGYEITRYEPKFKDAIATLQRRLWSGDATRNRAFFEWRYEQNPHAGDPLILLAFKDGELIAMRALFGSLWEAGSKQAPQLCYLSDDLVVTPGHESHGLFAAFTEFIRAELAARGHSFFLSLSALRVTRLQSIAGGARIAGAATPYGRAPAPVRMLDRMRSIAGKLPVIWRAAGKLLSYEQSSRTFARLAGLSRLSSEADSIVASLTARTAEMAELVRALGHDGRIRQVRDERYLSWRFRNPLHDYLFLYAEHAGELNGYLVLERAATERGNPRRIHIADWEARSAATLEHLLAHVVKHGAPAEIVTWSATLGPARLAALARYGFAPTDLDQAARGLPSIMVWPVDVHASDAALQLAGRNLLQLENWDLRMLDSSIV